MRMPKHHADALAFQSKWPDQIALLRTLIEGVAEEIGDFGDTEGYEARIEEINTEGYSGFIPTTDGGFDLCYPADLRFADASGYLPKLLEPMAESARKDAGNDFLEQDGERFGYDPDADYGDETWGRAFAFVNWLEEEDEKAEAEAKLPMDLPRRGLPLYVEARERLFAHEDAWLEGTYFYKARAILYSAQSSRNESGKDEVYLIAGVCTDLNYGRDSGTTWTFERTIPLADLTPELAESLGRELVKGLANA